MERRQEAAQGAGRGDRLELLVVVHPAGRVEDQLADGLAEGDLEDAGLLTSPLIETTQAGAPGPASRYHSPPFIAMPGTQLSVSTLLMTVGLPKRPVTAGTAACCAARRGGPRSPPGAQFLAADVAAGADEDFQVEGQARAENVVAEDAGA